MRYSVKFYPEKRNGITANVPIMLSVTFARQRMQYYTGKKCSIDPLKNQWDTENSKLKKNQITTDGQTSHDFNVDLDKISLIIDGLFKGYDVDTITPTAEQLREDLKRKLGKKTKAPVKGDFFSRFDQYIISSGLSDNRKTTLQTILNKLKAFDPGTTFEKLNLTEFKNHLSDKSGLSTNTVSLFLNGLKTFIKHANLKGYTDINPFKSFKIDTEKYGKPIYLSIAERDVLFNAILPDPNLSIVRDAFCLQCFLGCRYGDLMRLTKKNIVKGCINYIATKTKADGARVARVPLNDKAKQIIGRYNLPDGRLLPLISTHDINIDLKKLFSEVELTRIVTIADKKTQLDKQVTIDTIASTHMARRVFIGGLHKAGVKNEIIASMSGHVADSKSFARYYDIDQADQEKAMKLIE